MANVGKKTKAAATTAGGRVAVARTRKQAPTRTVARAKMAVDALGGPTRVGELLGVAPSQPSRWSRGEAVPGPDSARLLADLDHVVAVAEQVWDPELVPEWLRAPNAHLGGARPVDVARTSGSAPVVEALRAEAAGAFA